MTFDASGYQEFLASKAPRAAAVGIEPSPMPDHLFDFAAYATEFCLRQGRAALFLDTGLTKTRCQLEFSRQAIAASNGYSLILTPLAVARQFEAEGRSLGYDCRVVRSQDDVRPGINICNYDRLDKLNTAAFGCVSFDESSCLKNFSGKLTRALTNAFADTPFRLCATATPAPNDHVELGTHAEFLGIMPQSDMLIRWFINDSNDTGTWRLKGHATEAFWDWMSSWAVMASSPDDLGFDGSRFILPPLHIHRHKAVGDIKPMAGSLFAGDVSATSIFAVKRQTSTARACAASAIVLNWQLCHGSQNTPKTGENFINPTLQNGIGGRPKGEALTKIGHICSPITRETKTSGRPGRQSKAPSITLTETQNIIPTRNIGNVSKQHPGSHLERTQGEQRTLISEKALGLGSKTMSECSPNSLENALSVLPTTQEDISTSTSIIAMRQETLEDYSVVDAISALDNSKMIQLALREPHPISEVLPPWLVWCDTDTEQDCLEQELGSLAISIRGSQTSETKEALIEAWLRGDRPVLVTKSAIFGAGMNFQRCNNVIFVGRTFSYEAWYQAVRRCWRFGQTKPVNVHLIVAEGEAQIGRVIDKKAEAHVNMKTQMIAASRRARQVHSAVKVKYNPTYVGSLPSWL